MGVWWGIRKRITLTICVVILIVAGGIISIGYFWSYALIRDTIGKNYEYIASACHSTSRR